MTIATVIPLTKSLPKEELTYFTTLPVTVGAIVSVPIKNKLTDALVIKIRPAGEMKSELRAADFSLKKISKVKSASFFLPAFIRSARIIADHFATTPGAVIKSLSAKIILADPVRPKLRIPTIPGTAPSRATERSLLKQNRFAVQDSDDERITGYKGLIREAFARRTSALLLLPTADEIKKINESFGRGIDDYTTSLHNDLSTTELIGAWNKALDPAHPVLIIATPSFLSTPRSDLKLIIVDKEGNGAYKDFQRPFLDARYAAEVIAREIDARLVVGDIALRAETIDKVEQGNYHTISPLKYRSVSTASQTLVDLSGEHRPRDDEPQTISPNLYRLITDAVANNEQTFIFAARQGWSTATVCRDCGTTVLCSHCASPLVIHRLKADNSDPEKNYYVCHKCGEVRQPTDICQVCRGSRLALLGLGIEKTVEELTDLFPKTKIFRLDSAVAKTKKQVKSIIANFLSSPGSILVGTELAVKQFRSPLENIAVISIDPLLSLPDFHIGEKVFNLLLRLRGLASQKFLIQTRQPDNKIIACAQQGNLLEFFREELAWRKELGYPPTKTLIKITLAGPEKTVEKEMEQLELKLSPWEPLIFPAFVPKIKNQYQMHCLLKLEPRHWPDETLLAQLRTLPPAFIINVDPEDIL